MKIFKLIFVLTAMFFSQSLYALGLSNIQVNSNLGQPLNATINILAIPNGGVSTVKVTLASPKAFQRAGIDRAYELTKVEFKIKPKSDTTAVINITSQQSIQEPYLHFLIEVQWVGGRILREYTILLDPIIYKTNEVLTRQPISPIISQVRKPEKVTKSKTPKRTTAKSSKRTSVRKKGKYTVVKNDTLWAIAKRTRSENVSLQQQMDKIYYANPNAFIRGNRNLIKRGKIIQVPEWDSPIQQRDTIEPAIVNKTTSEAPVTRSNKAKTQPTKRELTRKVILTPAYNNEQENNGQRVSQTRANSPQLKKLQHQITSLQEQVTTLEGNNSNLKSENDELKGISGLEGDLDSKLAVLIKEVADLGSTLTIQSQKMAQLQRQLDMQSKEKNRLKKELALAKKINASNQNKPIKDVTLNPKSNVIISPDMVTGAEPVTKTSENIDNNEIAKLPIDNNEEISVETTDNKTISVATNNSEVDNAGSTMPVSNITINEKPEEADLVTSITNSVTNITKIVPGGWLTIGGGTGALILLFLAGFFIKSRGSNEPAKSKYTRELSKEDTSEELERLKVEVNDLDYEHEDTIEDEIEPTEDDQDEPVDNIDSKYDEELLEEVDVYIAYERFSQAEELLISAIEKYPQHNPYDLKLLEIYAKTENVEKFEIHAKTLYDKVNGQGSEWDQALELWKKLATDREIFEGDSNIAKVAVATGAVVAAGAVTAVALSSDEDELGVENELDLNLGEEEPELDMDEISLDADDDFSLDDADDGELS
ncbi:MAG: LysM peptidoglycan-binding domain-containing protein, partial [Bacteroidales bacterium]|nr:LysM peptidoglycan-binding domain-containing protein [Bacteroidales bacterium]